jgi:hypothetical protein
MPVPITCPACGSRLKAADDLAGGEVDCPRCGRAVPVPDPDAPPAAKKAARPIVADRPRKPAKKASDGPPWQLVAAGVGGGLVLLAVTAAVIYVIVARRPAPPAPAAAADPVKPAAVPPVEVPKPAPFQWVRFAVPDTPVSVVMPNGPPEKTDPLDEAGEAVGAMMEGAGGLDRWLKQDGERTYTVTVFRPAIVKALEAPELKGLDIGLDANSYTPELMLKTLGTNRLMTGGGAEVSKTEGVQNGVPYRQTVRRSRSGKPVVVRVYGLPGLAVGLRADGPGVGVEDQRVGEFFAGFAVVAPAKK